MAKRTSLSLAVEHAKRQRDHFAELHAQAQRTVSNGQAQLVQLQTYAKDTEAKWVRSGALAYTSEVLHHYHQFIAKLQEAIGMQQDVLVGLHGQLDQAHAVLVQGELRLAAIEKLHTQRLRQQQVASNRREQAQTDELATMQFLRTRKTLMPGASHDT